MPSHSKLELLALSRDRACEGRTPSKMPCPETPELRLIYITPLTEQAARDFFHCPRRRGLQEGSILRYCRQWGEGVLYQAQFKRNGVPRYENMYARGVQEASLTPSAGR